MKNWNHDYYLKHEKNHRFNPDWSYIALFWLKLLFQEILFRLLKHFHRVEDRYLTQWMRMFIHDWLVLKILWSYVDENQSYMGLKIGFEST